MALYYHKIVFITTLLHYKTHTKYLLKHVNSFLFSNEIPWYISFQAIQKIPCLPPVSITKRKKDNF